MEKEYIQMMSSLYVSLDRGLERWMNVIVCLLWLSPFRIKVTIIFRSPKILFQTIFANGAEE